MKTPNNASSSFSSMTSILSGVPRVGHRSVELSNDLTELKTLGSTVVSCRERLCKLGPGVLHAVALIYNDVRFAHYSKAEVLTNYQVNPFHLALDRPVFDNGVREANPSLHVMGRSRIDSRTNTILTVAQQGPARIKR